MHRLSLLIVDLVLLALATVVALLLRDNLEFNPGRFHDLLPYLALTLAVAVPVILTFGLNRAVWRLSAMADYLRVIGAVIGIVLLAVAVAFVVFRLDGIARSVPILQAVLGIFFLVGSRVVTRLRYATRRRASSGRPPLTSAPQALENVLVVGVNPIAELYLESAAEFAPDRIRIVGLVGRGDRHTGRLIHQHKVLGTPEEVASILQNLEVHGVLVDRIVVTVAWQRLSSLARESLLEIERNSSTKLDLFSERMGLDVTPRSVEPQPAHSPAERSAFHFDPAELRQVAERRYWRVKRAIDVIGAAVLIVLALPLALVIGPLVVIEVGFPAMFWQQRPGRDGRPFKLYKFRTMAAAHDDQGHRVPDERRLSSIGRFLRRTRLDELPQLYNILVGEMSFVGPRPLLVGDQPEGYAARLVVRPGLTGYAQVKGGRQISSADKAALDVWYVQNASLALDFEILARTVPMVLFGERTNSAAIARAWRDLQEAGVCSRTGIGSEDGRLATSSGRLA
jgi:lipopolysaccharide/colanic/teichoic acid biosynthesis glycosyltransferase